MVVQTEEKVNYCQMLKAKLEKIDLKDLLQPHFSKMLDRTINTVRLALILFKRGVLTLEEMEQCMNESSSVYQNLEVYQALKNKKAGKDLIDALEETENLQVLQLLVDFSDQPSLKEPQLEPTVKSFLKVNKDCSTTTDGVQIPGTPENQTKPLNSNHVFTLKTVSELKKTPSNKYWDTIGAENFSRIQEDNFEWTLARVATTSAEKPVDCTRYLSFLSNGFGSAHEADCIKKFLESSLQLDLETQTMGRKPREIYINTRSFSEVEWEWFSKFLSNFCRDSLENLWLDNVSYVDYFYGTEWMETLFTDQKSSVMFANLKFFNFQADGSSNGLAPRTLDGFLRLVKSPNYPPGDFWNRTRCQVQIWSTISEVCWIFMDPAKGILSVEDIDESFQKDIESILRQQSDSEVPVLKLQGLAVSDTGIKFLGNLTHRDRLTHLSIGWKAAHDLQAVTELMNSLSQFKALQTLGLIGVERWPMDLKQLDVLENLSFLYLVSAVLNSGGFGVDLYPWRPSVQTIVLADCDFKLKSLEWPSSSPDPIFAKLEPKRSEKVKGKIRTVQCTMSKMSQREVETALLSKFLKDL